MPAFRSAMIIATLVAASAGPAHAIRSDECEQQRAQYPTAWNDVSKETPLFRCQSHYAGAMQIRLGAADKRGRAVMSLVPLDRDSATPQTSENAKPIYRIWLDADQVQRLKAGKYFATVVRAEDSCWIRGDLSEDPVFVLDNADPKPDSPDASAFYNLAPRISAFRGQAYFCEREPAKSSGKDGR